VLVASGHHGAVRVAVVVRRYDDLSAGTGKAPTPGLSSVFTKVPFR
jgi:hypothetical protein